MDKINCRYYATGGGGGKITYSLPERTIWIAVKNENAGMLASDVYDAFVLVPLYLAMYCGQDLHIHGCISKRLYKNVMNYLQRILCDFSDDLSNVDVHVEGFREAEGRQNIIGTGISCGVDSLTTIYDRYVHEDDPEYKINALFFFNVGWHGDYYDENSEKLFFERYALNKPAADDLGLPLYLVRTNFHAFAYSIYGNHYPGSHMGYFSVYSCVLGLGRVMKKYYVSSCFSYIQMLIWGMKRHDIDLAEFSESYMLPLIHTEHLELVIDGCQYERNEKVKRIADWDIARKYLNVCVVKSDGISDAHNCSKCAKCMLTLMTLEAIGKLDNFSGVFDFQVYRKHFKDSAFGIAVNHFRGIPFGNEPDPYVFLNEHGFNLPSRFNVRTRLFVSKLYMLLKRVIRKLRKILRKISRR